MHMVSSCQQLASNVMSDKLKLFPKGSYDAPNCLPEQGVLCPSASCQLGCVICITTMLKR